MNISTFGARFYGGQIDRIDEGLKEFGHRINDPLMPPDLIYCNDMANWKHAFHKYVNWPKAKFILNVLDVPYWVPDWKDIHDDWCGKLFGPDKITCISKAVQKDIKNYFNIDAEVIYNPTKNITNLNLKRTNPFLFVGRANDKTKRFYLIKETLSRIEGISQDGSEYLTVIGGENPMYGKYLGILNDEKLNYYYNISKYIIYPAKFDGLGLPPIEMLLSGGIPIVCNDSETSIEFFPKELLCAPNSDSIINKINEIISFSPYYKSICDDLAKKYSLQFSPKQIAQNILDIYAKLD